MVLPISIACQSSKDSVKLACGAPLIFSKASRGSVSSLQEEHRMGAQSLIHLFYLSRQRMVCVREDSA